MAILDGSVFNQVIKQAQPEQLQCGLLRLVEVRLRLPAFLALTRVAVIRILGDGQMQSSVKCPSTTASNRSVQPFDVLNV